MELTEIDSRLAQRANWLIRLRWIAVVSVVGGTFFFSRTLGISMHSSALYGLALVLALYNLGVFLLLYHLGRADGQVARSAVEKIINVQISADLLILTALLHFSGGIENPFVFFFIFHMIIASILLSVRDSYLQATFAVLLFGLLVLLEYSGTIEHYCLGNFVPECFHREKRYIFGTLFAFTITLYVIVYMGTYISTKLKHAEQAARDANILLREKDRIKDEYVLRVTHDIKGHLAAIQSCLGLLVSGKVCPIDGKAAEFAERAHNRTKKLAHFVRALLELTKMRLGGQLKMEVFPLKETIDNAFASVKIRAGDKSISLSWNVEASVGQMSGNQFSIEEVVTNVLLNAIKYTPEEGNVTLNAKDQGDSILIEIVDSGIGIPEDDIEHVFDEFFRASNARKVERDGTGLGLSIVKHIVERHGGAIDVQSKCGKGAKFTITLPKGDTGV